MSPEHKTSSFYKGLYTTTIATARTEKVRDLQDLLNVARREIYKAKAETDRYPEEFRCTVKTQRDMNRLSDAANVCVYPDQNPRAAIWGIPIVIDAAVPPDTILVMSRDNEVLFKIETGA